MDEVHIKDDLIYDKHEGTLVGFANLGDTNNHLLQFEASLSGDSACQLHVGFDGSRSVRKTELPICPVFMFKAEW